MAYEKVETSAWKPENKGDEIEGQLLEIKGNVGANNSMIYTLGVENKPITVWGSTVLDPKMLGVKIGDQIKIVYEGLGEASPGKNAPKLFEVFVDRTPTPPIVA